TVIPLTGWASRRFGAKRVYLASLVVFTAGSALCGLAGSATMLIVFRVLQGVGGGMIMPVGQMILADAAGPKRMGRVMSVLGLAEVGIQGTFGSAKVIAPLIVGVALLVAFVLHCTRTPMPLLDMRLFRRGTYAAASVVMFFLGAALFGALILMPLYYQQLRHL